MNSPKIYYPITSIVCALISITYFYISTQTHIIDFYKIPTYLFHNYIQLFVVLLFFLIIFIDMRAFYITLKNYEKNIKKLNDQINELLIAKKKLQNKAHTFSGHADKLKLFISDRLLEYIEYDEKFLHFKSIASEVRHNGVICFDKVQTALKHAIEHTSSEQSHHTYNDALTSMIYLWDLLELSTTDNLALHISNQLCECEEIFYQSLLNDNDLTHQLSPPTLPTRSAVIRALNPFLDPPLNNSDESDTELTYQDSNFWIKLQKTKSLLGNENHIVLLLENLINNAVFYSSKKSYSHKDAKVAIQLFNYQGSARFSIYNHGPHISDEDKDQIFQLGYSTRRVRQHNGKGLGLYFVNEIIKGYEGKITFNNIHNREEKYSIRIDFADESVITEVIETQLFGTKLVCKQLNDTVSPRSIEWTSKTIEWSSKVRVLNIEVSTLSTRETISFTTTSEKNIRFFDPEDPSMPRWVIDIAQRKRSNKITFTPLNIHGVCFFVDLPCAESRLDHSFSADEYNDTGAQDLATLRKNFIAPDIVGEHKHLPSES